MGRFIPYKLLKDITSHLSKDHVDNKIPKKQIPPNKHIPPKNPKLLEDGRGELVCTYSDVVSTVTATDRLSNGEEGCKSKKIRELIL